MRAKEVIQHFKGGHVAIAGNAWKLGHASNMWCTTNTLYSYRLPVVYRDTDKHRYVINRRALDNMASRRHLGHFLSTMSTEPKAIVVIADFNDLGAPINDTTKVFTLYEGDFTS